MKRYRYTKGLEQLIEYGYLVHIRDNFYVFHGVPEAWEQFISDDIPWADTLISIYKYLGKECPWQKSTEEVKQDIPEINEEEVVKITGETPAPQNEPEPQAQNIPEIPAKEAVEQPAASVYEKLVQLPGIPGVEVRENTAYFWGKVLPYELNTEYTDEWATIETDDIVKKARSRIEKAADIDEVSYWVNAAYSKVANIMEDKRG